MKSHIRSILLLFIIVTATLTSSCRSDVDDIIDPEDGKSLKANSKIAKLILRVAMNDGSVDDIIDNANCFSIKLPIVIYVNGQETSINSEEDFKAIQEIFDISDNDIDKIDYVFPITIIRKDFSEKVIKNSEQLEDVIENCYDDDDENHHDHEQEDHENIKCVDFKYPFSVSAYDRERELIQTITFNSDKEVYEFIKTLDEKIIANLNFPVTIVLSDNTEVSIPDLNALEQIIEDIAKDCLEEDNISSDSTLTKNEFTLILISHSWKILKYKNNQNNQTKQYKFYTFNFQKDGSVTIINSNGSSTTGTWSANIMTNDKSSLTLDFGNQSPLNKLNNEWNIKKAKYKQILLDDDKNNQEVSKDQLFFSRYRIDD